MTILVDTSVWIDHLLGGDPAMDDLLQKSEVVAHTFVIGELAMGSLSDRVLILASLGALPRADVATDDEVLSFVEQHRLFSIGIGYIDAHLLASTLLTSGCTIWTRDRRLRLAAERLGLAAKGLK